MKPKILIIDDEKEIRDVFKGFLENENVEIVEASNGHEAFNLVTNEQFDLYITDVFMPEMNGVEFLKILKMLDPDAVVIIITGYDNMDSTRQALDYGAFRFLTKPVKMIDFKSIVQQGLLERRKLYHTSTSDKLLRLKDKINSNYELKEKLVKKLHSFLKLMEERQLAYIEMGGPGTRGRIWGKQFSVFKPIAMKNVFNQDEINFMVVTILNNEQLDTLISKKFIKTNYEYTENNVKHRYRFNIYFEMDELVMGIKITRRSLINMEAMKFPTIVLNRVTFKNENSGLVIVSGPPGSGKSSLIDAIVNVNNSYLSGNIFIISDSIEYYHESKNSVVRHQETHRDVNGVAEALQQCLSYKPNLVAIDNINSEEVLEGVFRLVDTGCLVLATMEKKSVVEVIYKLLSFYSQSEYGFMKKHIARTLSAVICVQLLPSALNRMIMVREIMLNNDQLSSVITSGNIDEVYEIIQRGKKSGMNTMEQDLVMNVRAGLLTSDMAVEYANNPHLLKTMLQYT